MKSAYLQNLDDAFLKSPESFGKKYEAKLEDFKILRLVGTGTFGKVFLVEQKHTKK
jgi:serine/threonine protein kinase